MKPDSAEVKKLVKYLRSLHGSRFNELQTDAKKLADYIGGLIKKGNFKLIDATEPSKHVGSVIVDGVLQVGKDYEKGVRPAVDRIKTFREAATLSGFKHLLTQRHLKELTGKYKSEKVKYDLLRVANFFADRKLDTFEQLHEWLGSEGSRDELMTMKRDPSGTVFSVADKTADYFRKLVRHWDALAVDTFMGKELLDDAGIDSKKYVYKEKRTIYQLVAMQMEIRPLDLDSSLYKYYVALKKSDRSKSIAQSQTERYSGRGNADTIGGKGVEMSKDGILKVALPSEKMARLEAMAHEYGQDPATLASIWIIDRLSQLRQHEGLPPARPGDTSQTITGERLPEEGLEDVKLRLAGQYISDPHEKSLFLQAPIFKQWGNYIGGLVLTKRGKTPFTPKDIKRILRDELIPEHYGKSRSQENEVLTADVRVDAPDDYPHGFPCLQRIERGMYKFIGFKKGIERKYGKEVLEKKLSSYEKE